MRFTLRIRIEGQLRVHHLQEKLPLAFGEYLELWLSGELREKLIALARDSHYRIRSQLVSANVVVEDLRIDRDFFVLFDRFNLIQWIAGVEQMPSDVVRPAADAMFDSTTTPARLFGSKPI